MTTSEETAMDEWVRLFANRNDMAEEYARIMLQDGMAWEKWPTLNQAIIDRWSMSGLHYIKTRAWKIARIP